MNPCPCHEPLVPGHRCWATETTRMRMLERVAEAAREWRHSRLSSSALVHVIDQWTNEDALSALPAGTDQSTETKGDDHEQGIRSAHAERR